MSRNTLLLVVVFGSFANTGSCQDQRVIDSLQAVIKGSSGAEEYDAWHWLVTEYVDLDNQKALQLMKLAEEAAYDSGDTLSIIKSQRLKAQILFRLERTRDVMSTLHNLENKMPLWRFPDERLTILNLFGVCYLVMSKFDKSLNYFFQTYERSKEAEDEQYEIVSIKNIGVVYYKLKDYRKALQYMKQGTALELDQGRRNCMSSMNISLCYTHLADFDSAKIYLDQSIEFCGSDCGLQPMTHIHYAAGCMQLGLNEVSSAKDEFLKSLNYSRKMEDVRMQLDNIYLLSKIFIGENDLVSAEKFLKVGESIIRQGIPYNMEMIKVYEQMSELYLAMKRYEMASHYQSMYIVLRDSIYNEALTTNLMRIESSFLEQEN